jgi:sulfopropanediol 3-dehydrogenase
MGIKFLKKSKPESERVQDDVKVRATVEDILQEIERHGDVAVRKLSQKFDGYMPENFQLNESEVLAAVQKVSTRDIEDIKFAQTQIRRFAEEQ